MNDYILFKNLDGKYLTLKDCIEENKKEESKDAEKETEEKTSEENKNEEAPKTVIYYVTDEIGRAHV